MKFCLNNQQMCRKSKQLCEGSHRLWATEIANKKTHIF